jgi:hypothetical protein
MLAILVQVETTHFHYPEDRVRGSIIPFFVGGAPCSAINIETSRFPVDPSLDLDLPLIVLSKCVN